MATMNIQIQNNTTSNVVFAYVTGQALDNGNHVCLIQSDGKTPYYPANPSAVGTKLSQNCSIKLGAPGSTTNVTIPHLAGGRIWFSTNKELTFLLNPGPALVEPSVTNPSDPNINFEWDFCEFTFANNQLYANITYVDFVSLSVGMTLTTTTGEVQKVLGLKSGGLQSIVSGLQNNSLPYATDWKKLIYAPGGTLARVLSPNAAQFLNGGNLFSGYYDSYVNTCWSKYATADLIVDTQAQWGVLHGRVTNNLLTFPGNLTFAKPSSKDIFSCSTGPFSSNVGALGPLTARISAALNRSVLAKDGVHPTAEKVSDYYQDPITNYYSKLVHAANQDGRGYAFPYDDVPGVGVDQSGFVNGNPQTFIVTVS